MSRRSCAWSWHCLWVLLCSVVWLLKRRNGTATGVRPHRSGLPSKHAQPTDWTCPYRYKPISCAARQSLIQQYTSNSVQFCIWDDSSAHHPDRLSAANPPRPDQFMWDRHCLQHRDFRLFSLTTLSKADSLDGCCGDDTYYVYLGNEPPEVYPLVTEHIRTEWRRYDFVTSLAGRDRVDAPNMIVWPWGSSWVPLHQWKVHNKSKLCSIIASNKRDAPGHKLRHEIVQLIQSRGWNCDVFGRGYREVEDKREALADYMFSIVIENSINAMYMSEKLIDSLVLGTVPVYWGCDHAVDTFGRGVIPWRTVQEFEGIFPTLTPELYRSMAPHQVSSSLETARRFVNPETWLWDHVFSCAVRWYAVHEACDG